MRNPRLSWLIPVLLATLFSPAVPACPGLKVENAWIRETPPGVNVAAAYMELINTGDTPIKVTGISSPDFSHGEFHSMSMANGRMHMEELKEVIVPARGNFQLQPDGSHVMLFDPKDVISAGSVVSLELKCGAGAIPLRVPVYRRNRGETSHHHE